MRAKYVIELQNVILRKIWLIPAFLPLTDEDAGKLIKALCRFWSGEEADLEDPKLETVFVTISEAMEISARRFLEKTGNAAAAADHEKNSIGEHF